MEVSLDQNIARKPFIHPKKFIVYLVAVATVMLFAGLSSAYLVSKMSGEWLEFDLPTGFIYSSVVVILSSLTLHLGYLSLKKNELGLVKIYLTTTLLLAIVFLLLQFYSFTQIYADNIVLSGRQSNPSGSYLYIITTLHALHLVAGICFVIYLLLSLVSGKLSSENSTRYEGCQVFWHFLGGLWLYLYVFFIINH